MTDESLNDAAPPQPDEFFEAIASIENARSVSAVQVAQEKFAPLREQAVALLEEFAKQRERLEPFLREATDKHNRAYLAGVHPDPSLRQTLHEAWTSLEDGPKSATAVIQRIDTLTEYNLYQGHDRYIPRMLEMCRDHMDHLERLATALRFHLSELKEKVKHEARRVAPATAIHIPDRNNGVVVQSNFDPRSE